MGSVKHGYSPCCEPDCETPVSRGQGERRERRCKPCAARYRLTAVVPTCANPDCPNPLFPNPRRKGKLCHPCQRRARVPTAAERAKKGASLRARHMDPAFRAAHAERVRKSIAAKIEADPEWHARLRERCGLAARGRGPWPEDRKRVVGRKNTERALGWCPPEYRDEYRALRINYKYPAKVARRMIEAEIAKDMKRYQETGQLQRTGVAS